MIPKCLLNHYIIIESSHLFRAGEKFSTQLFVIDVSSYLAREVYRFQATHQTMVLFGSVKKEQADKYVKSLIKQNIDVIKMDPVVSTVDKSHVYYKPIPYLQGIFSHIPRKSTVVMVGFHNHRYEEILIQYKNTYNIHVAAFSTQTAKGEYMQIPRHWDRLCCSCRDLDYHIDGIKTEFKKISKGPTS